jgi:hypothetical protein
MKHLPRECGILNEDILVNSGEPEHSASLKTSENSFPLSDDLLKNL